MDRLKPDGMLWKACAAVLRGAFALASANPQRRPK
jgi:hypothetical protein